MSDRTESLRLAILRALRDENSALSSEHITQRLLESGMDIKERTVRLHLLALDREGFTEYRRKHGRLITDAGRAELSTARAHDKVGLLSARIDQLTYQMDFDPAERTGRLISNISLIESSLLPRAWRLMRRVYDAGYAMGRLIAALPEGSAVGSVAVPAGYTGIATVCSVSLNGILLRRGIPVQSRFGGLLQVQNREPTRFAELIYYSGTSVDPLEVFIRGGMTDYLGATKDGSGLIGAGFREIPALAAERLDSILQELDDIGLGCVMRIGKPDQPVCETPVFHGNVGLVVIAGLNPVAILEEAGIPVVSKALSGLLPFAQFKDWRAFDESITSAAG